MKRWTDDLFIEPFNNSVIHSQVFSLVLNTYKVMETKMNKTLHEKFLIFPRLNKNKGLGEININHRVTPAYKKYL